MTNLIILLKNNRNMSVYTGGDIHGLYSYIEIIVSPTILTTSDHFYHHFSPSSSTNNDIEIIQKVVAAPCMIQKSI